jgi:hypothetical protein
LSTFTSVDFNQARRFFEIADGQITTFVPKDASLPMVEEEQ